MVHAGKNSNGWNIKNKRVARYRSFETWDAWEYVRIETPEGTLSARNTKVSRVQGKRGTKLLRAWDWWDKRALRKQGTWGMSAGKTWLHLRHEAHETMKIWKARDREHVMNKARQTWSTSDTRARRPRPRAKRARMARNNVRHVI